MPPGDFVSGHGGVIYKKSSDMEKKAFEQITGDVLKPFVPLYYKSVIMQDESGSSAEYVGMQDLLGLFDNPTVMDVKMVRQTKMGESIQCRA